MAGMKPIIGSYIAQNQKPNEISANISQKKLKQVSKDIIPFGKSKRDITITILKGTTTTLPSKAIINRTDRKITIDIPIKELKKEYQFNITETAQGKVAVYMYEVVYNKKGEKKLFEKGKIIGDLHINEREFDVRTPEGKSLTAYIRGNGEISINTKDCFVSDVEITYFPD